MKQKIAIGFFLSFAILPIAAGLVYAMLYSIGLAGALGRGLTGEYWHKIFLDRSFWVSVSISALIAIFVTVAAAIAAFGVLVGLLPWLRRRNVRLLLHLPLAVPPVIAAFVSFQWLGSSGLIARLSYAAGWIADATSFPPLVNDPFNIGIIMTLFLGTFPFLLLLLLSQYESAHLDHYAALAATMGASQRQIQQKVIAPVLLSRAAPTLVMYTIFLFGAYEVPLLLGQQSETMISVYISQKFKNFSLAELPVAYCATVLYAVVVLSLSYKQPAAR